MLNIQATDATILLYVTFIMLYSTTICLPVDPYPQSNGEAVRNIFETDNWNETKELPLSTTRSPRSKRLQSSRNSRQDSGFLNHERQRKYDWYTKNGLKRNLDIGLHFNIPTTTKHSLNKGLDKLEEVLEQALESNLQEVFNASGCPSCDEEVYIPVKVKPAYNCDEWDSKYRLCILERNIGDTVTFYLSTGKTNNHKRNVTWKKEFHLQDSKTRTSFVINPDNTPENIIIGKQGFELRVSPITEIDVGYNIFSATVNGRVEHNPQEGPPQNKVYFMIRIVPVDLGFVYVGETIELNLRSFVSLPSESLTFRWYMEKYGEHSTLPSNMRTSASGSSIKISELRQEQEGILACSVYTNLNFLATKKRFLMKDLIKNNDVLKSVPDHDIHFEEVKSDRERRDPKKLPRHKRALNIDDIVEKALEKSITTKKSSDVGSREVTSSSYKDYDVGMDIENGEARRMNLPEDPFDSQNRYQDLNQGVNGNAQVDISVENNPVDFENTVRGNGQAQDINGVNPFGKNGNNFDTSQNQATGNGKNYFDVDVQNKNGAQGDESEVILNIDKIPTPRRIPAEEKIGKLISVCYSDFECASVATCVRSSLKRAGFCKCLPGFFGVGIFCREDIWISKNNYQMEQLHNPDDMPYPTMLPMMQESN